MRLKKLAIENLNALYDAHTVDFENDFQGTSLFLVMGPTGSGKSTLLDAISLALFGVTPRLGRTGGASDETIFNVVSRGTAKALAELVFTKTTQAGEVRYKASWSCRRARGKVTGEFQKPKRSLAIWRGETSSWETVVDSDVQKVFQPAFDEALEGMGPADFQRSMLLAQGEFAAFLEASDIERADILERLTRTHHYREIGSRASARRQRAREEFERVDAELSQIPSFSPADLLELQSNLARTEEDARQLQRRQDELRRHLRWLEDLEALGTARAGAAGRLERARQAREQAQPELARLSLHEESAAAFSELDGSDRLGGMLELLTREIEDLDRQVEAAVRETQALARVRVEKEALLQKAIDERDASEPQIMEARVRRQERDTATRSLDALRGRLRQAEAEALRLEGVARPAAETAHRALLDWEAAVGDLTALEGDAGLPDSIAVLGQRLLSLEAVLVELENETAALARLERTVEETESARVDAERLLQEHARKADEIQAELSRASDALQALCGEATSVEGARSAWTKSRMRLASAGPRLEALAASRRNLERELALLAARRLELVEVESLVEAGQQHLGGVVLTLTASRERSRRLEGDLEIYRWARNLAEERDRLRDSEPCPLCGSTGHPAVDDPGQSRKDQEVRERCEAIAAELDAEKASLSALEEDRQETERRLHGNRERALDMRKGIASRESSVSRDEEEMARLSEIAGLPPGLDVLDFERLREEARKEEEALEESLRLLSAAEAAERAASDAWRQHQDQAARLREEAVRQQETVRVLTLQRAEAREKLARRKDGARQGRELLAAALLASGLLLPGDRIEELRAAVAAGNERAERFRAASERRQKAEGRRDRTASEAERAALLARSARESHAQLFLQLEEAEKEWRILDAAARAVLSGQDPDTLWERLKDAVEEARRSLDGVSRREAALLRDLASLMGSRSEKAARLEALTAERQEVLGRLQEALELLELDSKEALAARRLTPADVAILTDRRAGIAAEESAAETLSQVSEENLSRHVRSRPLELSEGVGAGEVRAGLEETDGRLAEALRAAGQLRERVNQNLENASLRSRKQAEKEAARKALDLWSRVNKLIGENEGRAFQRFAQILNLRDLLERANARLAKLRPRYRLVPATGASGLERLAFAVRDAAHGSEERPVNTLSGGETFLVSLALALALADYRTVQMRIETLLLDEGFGTLDPKTLDEVMGTLEGLTAPGTQIGVISHLEALVPRIQPKIVVEPIAPGRSRLRVDV